MKISVNIRRRTLYVHGYLLWIRVEIRFDAKNYSAVVKSKIGYRVEEDYRHWTVW